MAAGGVRLGSAYFELDASAAPLIQALKQSEDASKKSVAAISQATGIAEKDVQRFAQTYVRAEQTRANAAAAATLRIIKGYNDQADAAEKSAQKLTAANTKAAGGFGDVAKGALAFGVAAAGVTVGAAAVHAAMSKITEVTQEANQAQFALNATYQGSAAAYTQFAAAQATATQRTTAEVQQSIVAFGSLSNRYAITADQVKELTKRSADLAAVKGITTVEAAKRLEAALRGEAESAEFLGLTLNSDYLKKFADMTAEQRKNWETLDPLIKAQITYREALRQTDPLLGSAAKRSGEAAGASDNLRTAVSNLALTFGRELGPAVATSQEGLAGWINSVDEFVKRAAIVKQAMRELGVEYLGDPSGVTQEQIDRRVVEIIQRRRNEADIAAGIGPNAAAGPSPADIDKAQKQYQRDKAEQEGRVKRELEAADKANDATAESAIRAIDTERKEKERWYDEEKRRIEARRTYQLDDIEKRKDAAIAGIEAEKQARKDAFDQQTKDAEREKTFRLRAAEEARDQIERRIEDQKRQNDRDRETEDRDLADTRQRQDREREDFRAENDREREADHRKEIRRIEERHSKAVRGFETEADAERASSERSIRALDRLSQKEDDRHRKALAQLDAQAKKEDDLHRKAIAALDDEQDARLSILDIQLKALDAQDKAEASASRTADLQKRVADAQAASTAARGTGTPEQITEARGALTQAIKSGDPISGANARERLVQLAGQGNAAIKKTDEDLAKAQEDLRKEGVDQARDAERQKLKDAQDAIKAEIDARKRQEDDRNRARKDGLDKDRQAEDERSRLRKSGLDDEKRVEQDKLKDVLAKLDIRKQKEADAHDERVRQVNQEYEEGTQRLQDARRDQDREIEDRRQKEDRERGDRRKAEDEALAARRQAAQQTFELERADAEEHYNGPNGVITKLKAASEATEREYSRQLVAARAAFEEERKSAERVFTNPEGNGLLDLLAAARQSEFDKLEASKAEWTAWGTAASAAIKAAMADLDEFIKRGANVPRIGGDSEAQRSPGSGKLTSSSSEQTRSGKSGKQVQGDLASWINDAMDLAGVPDNWFNGLMRLVQLESGGDPHNVNPEDVIDKNGKNLGKAKGLLQMLDDTFRSYRDKSLPNDIFDPVANATASIRYIMDTYGHVNHIPGLFEGTFKGYASGGVVDRPSYLVDARSGKWWGTIAEQGPEYVSPASQMSGAGSLIGNGPPLPDYGRMGAAMSTAHPGGAGQSSVVSTRTINVNGVGVDEFTRRIKRAEHREDLLTGVRR